MKIINVNKTIILLSSIVDEIVFRFNIKRNHKISFHKHHLCTTNPLKLYTFNTQF